MKFLIHTFIGSDSDGYFANIFGDEAERNALVNQCVDEGWYDDKDRPADPVEAWRVLAIDRGEAFEASTVAIVSAPIVPQDAVQAARAAVEALAFARDCLKAAGADRAADKARLALSSAKGAVRHAEGKASRFEWKAVPIPPNDYTQMILCKVAMPNGEDYIADVNSEADAIAEAKRRWEIVRYR